MKHITWYYEENTDCGYYHIYPSSTRGEMLLSDETLILEIPKTDDNSSDIYCICDNLDSMASRITEKELQQYHDEK